MASKKRVILSGMRPTGKLHLGNWIELEREPGTERFYMVADWHALTTDYEDPKNIEGNIEEMALDWLAAGLDPQKSVIFRQSWVREHAELSLILSMITPVSWLERNPTYKEQVVELKDKDISTHGFLGYPVLQASDILLYQATHVPVGEDQLPHLELSREIARRFNFLYKEAVFTEPQAILSHSPKVPGTDARKMSKSYNNCVYISDDEPALKKKVNSMFTDPLKKKAGDRGHPRPSPENPTGCVVFALHEVLGEPKDSLAQREKTCKDGSLGCMNCKSELAERLNERLSPIREKREKLAREKGLVKKMLMEGSIKAGAVASQTLERVRKTIGLELASPL